MGKNVDRWVWSGASVLLTWSLPLAAAAGAGAKNCPKPYNKVVPFQLPLGVERASVSIRNEVRFSYDCKQVLAQAEAGISAQFLSLDLDLLGAQASLLQNQRSSASNAYARLLVFGLEVAREDFDLENLLDTTLSPDTDFDHSEETVLNVGPIPVPLTYGIEGNVALDLKAGLQDLSFGLDANPRTDSRVYVQAGVNTPLAEVIAHGKMLLVNNQLKNNLRLDFEADDKLYLRLTARSFHELEALDVDVSVRTRLGVGPAQQNFERELFAWPGFEQRELVAEFSDRLALFE